jgi:hypothetical protein
MDEQTRARWVLIPWMLGSFAVLLVGQAVHSHTVVGVALFLIGLWVMAGAWFGKPRALEGRRNHLTLNWLPDPWWRLVLFAGGLFIVGIALAGLAARMK